MQNKWLVFDYGHASPNQAGSGLASFDFDLLSWSQCETTGDALQHRTGYVATCHDNALLIMGGKPLLAPYLHLNLLKRNFCSELLPLPQSICSDVPCCVCWV